MGREMEVGLGRQGSLERALRRSPTRRGHSSRGSRSRRNASNNDGTSRSTQRCSRCALEPAPRTYQPTWRCRAPSGRSTIPSRCSARRFPCGCSTQLWHSGTRPLQSTQCTAGSPPPAYPPPRLAVRIRDVYTPLRVNARARPIARAAHTHAQRDVV